MKRDQTLAELRASGRPPRIFTSEQIHEAGRIVAERLMREFPDLKSMNLIGLTNCSILVELGLKSPEDFYE